MHIFHTVIASIFLSEAQRLSVWFEIWGAKFEVACWFSEQHRVNEKYRQFKSVSLKVLDYMNWLVVWELRASPSDVIFRRDWIEIEVTRMNQCSLLSLWPLENEDLTVLAPSRLPCERLSPMTEELSNKNNNM